MTCCRSWAEVEVQVQTASPEAVRRSAAQVVCAFSPTSPRCPASRNACLIKWKLAIKKSKKFLLCSGLGFWDFFVFFKVGKKQIGYLWRVGLFHRCRFHWEVLPLPDCRRWAFSCEPSVQSVRPGYSILPETCPSKLSTVHQFPSRPVTRNKLMKGLSKLAFLQATESKGSSSLRNATAPISQWCSMNISLSFLQKQQWSGIRAYQGLQNECWMAVKLNSLIPWCIFCCLLDSSCPPRLLFGSASKSRGNLACKTHMSPDHNSSCFWLKRVNSQEKKRKWLDIGYLHSFQHLTTVGVSVEGFVTSEVRCESADHFFPCVVSESENERHWKHHHALVEKTGHRESDSKAGNHKSAIIGVLLTHTVLCCFWDDTSQELLYKGLPDRDGSNSELELRVGFVVPQSNHLTRIVVENLSNLWKQGALQHRKNIMWQKPSWTRNLCEKLFSGNRKPTTIMVTLFSVVMTGLGVLPSGLKTYAPDAWKTSLELLPWNPLYLKQEKFIIRCGSRTGNRNTRKLTW